MRLTVESAKLLKYRQEIFDATCLQTDGMPVRFFVSGTPRVWKRSTDRVQVPVKHGLYYHGYVTERNLHCFYTDRNEAMMFYPIKSGNQDGKVHLRISGEYKSFGEYDCCKEIISRCEELKKHHEKFNGEFFLTLGKETYGVYNSKDKTFTFKVEERSIVFSL